MRVSERIYLNASTDTVFKYLLNLENRLDYVPGIKQVSLLSPLPIRVGSQYMEKTRIAGRLTEAIYEITSLKEGHEISIESIKSAFPIRVVMRLSPNKEGSVLSIELTYSLSGMYRLASKIIDPMIELQTTEIGRNIKREVESR